MGLKKKEDEDALHDEDSEHKYRRAKRGMSA